MGKIFTRVCHVPCLMTVQWQSI